MRFPPFPHSSNLVCSVDGGRGIMEETTPTRRGWGGGDKKTKFPHRIKVIGQNNFVLISTDLLSKGTSGSKVCQ